MQSHQVLLWIYVCKVGDMVLLRNMKKLSRQESKAEEAWSGPYEVTEKAGNHTYYLKRSGDVNVNKTLYSSTRLKPYNIRQQSGRRSVKTEDQHQDSVSLFTLVWL